MKELIIKPIGVLRTQYSEPDKLPLNRQTALRSMLAVAELDENLAAGLSGFVPGAYVWLVYFHPKAKLASAEKCESGVFATRAPNHPNPISISLVEVVKIEDNRLYFNNADMPDSSRLVDIRPYVASEDSPSIE